MTAQSEITKTTSREGHGPKCSAEGQILNRVIRATDNGFELEGDPRHAELVVEQLNLQSGKSVSTPGADDPVDDEEDADQALDPSEASAFRAVAARCNYLASDRPDI